MKKNALTSAVKVGKARTGSLGKRVAGVAGRTATGGRGGSTDQAVAAGSRAYGRSAPGTSMGGGKTTGSVVETTTPAGGTPRPTPLPKPKPATSPPPPILPQPGGSTTSRSSAVTTKATTAAKPSVAPQPKAPPRPVAKKAAAKPQPKAAPRKVTTKARKAIRSSTYKSPNKVTTKAKRPSGTKASTTPARRVGTSVRRYS